MLILGALLLTGCASPKYVWYGEFTALRARVQYLEAQELKHDDRMHNDETNILNQSMGLVAVENKVDTLWSERKSETGPAADAARKFMEQYNREQAAADGEPYQPPQSTLARTPRSTDAPDSQAAPGVATPRIEQPQSSGGALKKAAAVVGVAASVATGNPVGAAAAGAALIGK